MTDGVCMSGALLLRFLRHDITNAKDDLANVQSFDPPAFKSDSYLVPSPFKHFVQVA